MRHASNQCALKKWQVDCTTLKNLTVMRRAKLKQKPLSLRNRRIVGSPKSQSKKITAWVHNYCSRWMDVSGQYLIHKMRNSSSAASQPQSYSFGTSSLRSFFCYRLEQSTVRTHIKLWFSGTQHNLRFTSSRNISIWTRNAQSSASVCDSTRSTYDTLKTVCIV